MDIGCHLPTQGPVATRDALMQFCREAERRDIASLWVSDHVRFGALGFQPKPGQKPHPPIWVGGNSPGAFRRVVTYGDGWHATFLQPPELRVGLDKLRAAADAVKRPFDTIELSMRVATKGPLEESRQAIVDLLGAYKRAGLTHVMLDIRRDSLSEMIENLDIVAKEIRPPVDAA